MGWSPEETKHQLTRVLAPWRPTGGVSLLQHWVLTTWVKYCLPGSSWEGNSVPRDFTGGWSCRHPLSSMCQDPRLPEGKRGFSGLSDVNLSEPIEKQTCRNKEALERGSLRTGYFFTASNYFSGVNLTLCFKTSRLWIVLLFFYFFIQVKKQWMLHKPCIDSVLSRWLLLFRGGDGF